MSKLYNILLPLCMLASTACTSKTDKADKADTTTQATTSVEGEANSETPAAPSKLPATKDPAVILARKQVPILCYHQIRNWTAKDSKNAKDYIVPIADFKQKIKMLADSGYHTILPDQLYDYLTKGAALPSKPIMLTFDDTDLDQYTIAAPELKKYGFKAVYFVMTVSIGRPNYMNKEQIKALSDAGNVIGSHTWDHHMTSKYKHDPDPKKDDWIIQIDKPTKKLEEITGKKVEYFAYPFGIWNKKGFPEFHKRGFKLAFGLADKRDPNDPLMCVRRILDSGYWSTKTLSNAIKNSF